MKTRIITAIVGILVLIGVLFTFDTLVFNFVIAAITLIAIHEVFKALGFGRKEWPMYAVFVPYTLLIMLSSYQVWRRLVMPASFLTTPNTMVPSTPPMAPSTVFLGLTTGQSLCLPKALPAK